MKIESRTSELESGIIYASFDKSLEELRKNNFEVISLPTNAALRIQEGKDSYIGKSGNYVREAVISIPNKGIYLVRNSPLLQLELAKEAAKANRSGKEYSIEESLAKEYAYKSSQDTNSEVFYLTDLDAISTNKFDKDKRALWLFQNQSENYGRFLYDNSLKEMPLRFNNQNYINKQKVQFVNQLWLYGLDDWSFLYGSLRGLHGNNRVRGVRSISRDQSSYK